MTRSPETTSVVIHDERTRKILRLALWTLAEAALPSGFEPSLYFPEDGDEQYWEARASVAEQVARYLDIAASLDLVDSTPIGGTVTLAVAGERLVERVAAERQGIDELPAGDVLKSRRLKEAHAAATRLLDELAPTEGAVA
jgi:hypothetical protein